MMRRVSWPYWILIASVFAGALCLFLYLWLRPRYHGPAALLEQGDRLVKVQVQHFHYGPDYGPANFQRTLTRTITEPEQLRKVEHLFRELSNHWKSLHGAAIGALPVCELVLTWQSGKQSRIASLGGEFLSTDGYTAEWGGLSNASRKFLESSLEVRPREDGSVLTVDPPVGAPE